MSFVLIRTLTNQVAEGGTPPALGVCVNTLCAPKAEISFGPLTWGGTAQASTAKCSLWRESMGRVDRVAEFTLVNGQVPLSPVVETFSSQLWLTVDSFAGGTAPTLSFDVYARKAE